MAREIRKLAKKMKGVRDELAPAKPRVPRIDKPTPHAKKKGVSV